MTIDQLLRLQSAFDHSRGFANLPGTQDGPRDRLSKIEFALIGLMGEVGEIASLIKRTRRDQAFGRSAGGPNLVELGDEVADVLSYLLKLAQHAGLDPAKSYLIKMCRNAHRFGRANATVPSIAITGPPGVGKTTLVQSLAAELPDIFPYVEQFEKNPFLDRLDFPTKTFNAGESQSWFLEKIGSFIRGHSGPVLLDQDPTAIVLVYSEFLYGMGYLTSADYDRQLEHLLYLEIEEANKIAGRTVILLEAECSVLAERCRQKTGPNLEAAFLEDMRHRFHSSFSGLPNVVRVDANRSVDSVLGDVREIAADVLRWPIDRAFEQNE